MFQLVLFGYHHERPNTALANNKTKKKITTPIYDEIYAHTRKIFSSI